MSVLNHNIGHEQLIDSRIVSNTVAVSPEEFYQLNRAIPFLDYIISELEEQFSDLSERTPGFQRVLAICRTFRSRTCALQVSRGGDSLFQMGQHFLEQI